MTTVGAATGAASIPTAGSATYVGVTAGHQIATDGTLFGTNSNLTAVADFGARSVSLASTNTSLKKSDLDFLGTLTYFAGSNRFTGNVTTVGGGTGSAPMTGTATGLFYGPAAEEIGGTFWVAGAGLASYGGAFGGKR